MSLPQLKMRRHTLSDLPTLTERLGALPDGISLRTHIEGDENTWVDLNERCFGSRMNFDNAMRRMPGYKPSSLFYLCRDGRAIASTAAVENDDGSGEGLIHFVGVDPDARGLGLSKHIVLAALYSLYSRGYETAVLTTDDFRLPAIKVYLSLGFEPVLEHESHHDRWVEVKKQLGL